LTWLNGRRLIQKLQSMAAEVEVAQLPRDDDLEDHAGLVRSAVERRRAQQRNAVVDPLMLHQRVDPFHRVRRAGDLVFRAQDEIEAVPGVRQTALVDRTGKRRRERRGLQPERCNGLIPGEVGSAAGEQIVEVGLKGSHTKTYAKLDSKSRVLHMIWVTPTRSSISLLSC